VRRVILEPGVGLGWRPQTAWTVTKCGVAFTEVVAENLDVARLPPALVRVAAGGTPVVPHGVGLSLGSAEGVDGARVAHLGRLAEALQAPLVSEHVAFVRGGGVEAGHLLPVPRTEAMLEILVENVRATMARLPVPLAVENIAALFEWPDAEMAEGEFLSRLVEATGVRLLLDLSNLHAAVQNHGWDGSAYLDELPLDAIAYVHVAGGRHLDGLYQDTHAHAVPAGPLTLLEALVERAGPQPALLERDDNFEVFGEVENELELLRGANRVAA